MVLHYIPYSVDTRRYTLYLHPRKPIVDNWGNYYEQLWRQRRRIYKDHRTSTKAETLDDRRRRANIRAVTVAADQVRRVLCSIQTAVYDTRAHYSALQAYNIIHVKISRENRLKSVLAGPRTTVIINPILLYKRLDCRLVVDCVEHVVNQQFVLLDHEPVARREMWIPPRSPECHAVPTQRTRANTRLRFIYCNLQ